MFLCMVAGNGQAKAGHQQPRGESISLRDPSARTVAAKAEAQGGLLHQPSFCPSLMYTTQSGRRDWLKPVPHL